MNNYFLYRRFYFFQKFFIREPDLKLLRSFPLKVPLGKYPGMVLEMPGYHKQ